MTWANMAGLRAWGELRLRSSAGGRRWDAGGDRSGPGWTGQWPVGEPAGAGRSLSASRTADEALVRFRAGRPRGGGLLERGHDRGLLGWDGGAVALTASSRASSRAHGRSASSAIT